MDLTTTINNLGGDYTTKVSDAIKQIASTGNNSSVQATSPSSDTFDSIYNTVSGLLDSTNSYIQKAQQAEVDFALGNITNTHELGVYQQKANLALQYTVAIRNKALEAYKEIMNMSI